jgi:hypothetical protein
MECFRLGTRAANSLQSVVFPAPEGADTTNNTPRRFIVSLIVNRYSLIVSESYS